MLIGGVDDAGRGAVIGPLVIAGVLVDESIVPKLVQIGVKDSKLLSPKRREQLAKEIRKLSKKHSVLKLSPAEVDKVVKTGKKFYKLNRLEAHAMAKVICNLKPDIVYVDASDVSPDRFRQYIMEEIPFKVQIVSEHKADRLYPVVSAASILAKVERDGAIAELKEKYSEIGSGYIADPQTVRFLESWIRNFESYPDFVRDSWKPAQRLKKSAETIQRRLV